MPSGGVSMTSYNELTREQVRAPRENRNVVEETIRKVLAEYARLGVDLTGVDREADLYTLGLTSHASVNVMLGLEDALGVEFPDDLLRKDTFRSIASIEAAVSGLRVAEG